MWKAVPSGDSLTCSKSSNYGTLANPKQVFLENIILLTPSQLSECQVQFFPHPQAFSSAACCHGNPSNCRTSLLKKISDNSCICQLSSTSRQCNYKLQRNPLSPNSLLQTVIAGFISYKHTLLHSHTTTSP